MPRDWTKGSVSRNLLALSWPMVVTEGMAVVVMTLDFVWIGRLGSAALAGVGVASMIAMLVMSANVGLIIGLRAMVARYIGSGDTAGAIHVAQQALVVSGVFGVVTSVVGVVFAVPMLNLFGMEADVAALGATYVRIMFAGMLGFSLRLMADNTMQASGDTVIPMKITILARGIHLGLAPAIIFGWWIFPEIGVAGAAVGNVVAHTLAMLIGQWVLFTGRSRLRITLSGFRLDLPVIWRMIKIGFPALVMTVQRAVGYVVLTRFMAPFGTVALAAHSIVQRVDTVLFMPSWAISSGAGVLVGQNLGAGQPQRATKSVWLALGMVAAIMLVGVAVALAWSEGIIGIFNDEPELLAVGASYLRIAAAGYSIMALVIVIQQALSGAGDTIPAMVISLLMVWAVQLPLAFFLPMVTDLGVFGVRWGIVVGILFGAVAYLVYFSLGRWKRRVL